jgi:hypothetical protein
MIGWLYKIIIGDFHSHKWEIINKTTVYSSGAIIVGYEYIQQCKHCGKLKTYKA